MEIIDDRISKLEARLRGFTQSEQQRENGQKKNLEQFQGPVRK